MSKVCNFPQGAKFFLRYKNTQLCSAQFYLVYNSNYAILFVGQDLVGCFFFFAKLCGDIADVATLLEGLMGSSR